MNSGVEAALQLKLLDDAAGSPAAWRVRASERARRLTVRIIPGGDVEIVVPSGTRPRAVQQFVSRHRRWIDRKVAQYQPAGAAAGDEIPALVRFRATGESWQVEPVAANGGCRVAIDGGRLLLFIDRSGSTIARHALQQFLRQRAQATLLPRLHELSAQCRLPYAGAQIRRQRTRWGSCSRRGTISLNACLLFQSPAIVRYLLVHELAHTRHLNHSRRFWSLVEQLEPQWRELDAGLAQGWREVPSWALR